MDYPRWFIQQVNEIQVKHYFAAIMILDFENERPITRLEGKVVNGSMQIAGGSPTRRTGSMQIVFDKDTFDLQNPNNLIAINKKIALDIGISNPFWDQPFGIEYGKTLWFKQGTFIVTGANLSVSPTSRTINIQFIDKMGMLNGVCGGTIPASISLHDRIEIDGLGNTTTSYPKIKQIIREVVHHFGGEHFSRIIINDVPDFGRQVATWEGTTPAWFCTNNGNFIVGEQRPGYTQQKILGDDVGYMSTELTYPGELVMKAGTTVTGILDEIVKTLGNFEYFYDVDGFFHFQKIQNFEMTGAAPLDNHSDATTPFNVSLDPVKDRNFQSQYLPKFQGDQFLNEFSSSRLISSASLNPNYANIKNDFVVWGSRKANKDEERLVRYHLAIDERPKDDIDIDLRDKNTLCQRYIWVARNIFTKEVLRYVFVNHNGVPSLSESGFWSQGNYSWPGKDDTPAIPTPQPWNASEIYKRSLTIQDVCTYGGKYWGRRERNDDGSTLPAPVLTGINNDWIEIDPNQEELILHSPALRELPANNVFDWREELYRKALLGWNTSTRGSYYDEELMAEWRFIFNPMRKSMKYISGTIKNPYWADFEKEWIDHFSEDDATSSWTGYNVDIVRKPQNIRYWLDLIDVNTGLGAYSVNRIGRRSVVKENNKINEVLNKEVPDIVFIDGTLPQQDIDLAEDEFISIGQKYCIIKPDYLPYFKLRNSFGTCFEEVRDLFYRHLIYNATASVSCIPILYLDVNNVVRFNFPELGITGNFVIKSLSWNLGNMSTMQIQVNEAIVIV